MFPRIVKCEDCGKIASVRGYGRIEYDWPETTTPGRETTIPTINTIRVTVDCPCCGVKSQDYFPNESSPSARHFKPAAVGRDATSRTREVRFQRLGPMNRPRP
jgi:hypothetical protein